MTDDTDNRVEVSIEESHTFVSLDRLRLGACVFLSPCPAADIAVVFVHGFTGGVGTWGKFHAMIDWIGHRFLWKRADAYFFTYSDVRSSIDDSASLLQIFVDDIYPRISTRVSTLMPDFSINNHAYKNLILVGHSEGALVIRAAVAYAGMHLVNKGKKKSILDARLALFAPAHFGFVPTRWLGALFALMRNVQIADIVVAYSPPATEMRDKMFLEQLRNVTERLYRDHSEIPAFSAHVLYGTEEYVLMRGYYFQDCRHDPELGRGHTSICKPDEHYDRPLRFVMMEDCP